MELETIEVDTEVHERLEQLRDDHGTDTINEAVRHVLGMNPDPDLDELGSPPT